VRGGEVFLELPQQAGVPNSVEGLSLGSDFIDDPMALLDGGVLRPEPKLMIWDYVTGID
jgi:hypothetical protein